MNRTLVKQIRNSDLVCKIIDEGKSYFHWLQKVSGLDGPLSSLFAETEFVSIDNIDDIVMEKAKEEVRWRYADEIAEQEGLNDKETVTLYKSIRGDCCFFEVIVCLSYSINEMFEDVDAYDGCSHFFNILIKNAGFDKFDEEDLDYWKKRIQKLLNREYEDTGRGGLFPLEWIYDYKDDRKTYSDQRYVSLWQQMNDWVDHHTNEDGEWVD